MKDLVNEFLEIIGEVFSTVFGFIYDFIFEDMIDFISGIGSKIFYTFSDYVESGNFLVLILGLIVFMTLFKVVISIIRGWTYAEYNNCFQCYYQNDEYTLEFFSVQLHNLSIIYSFVPWWSYSVYSK